MIILGAVLIVLGLIFGLQLLWIIGLVVLLLGLFAGGAGLAGRTVGGRRHWY